MKIYIPVTKNLWLYLESYRDEASSLTENMLKIIDRTHVSVLYHDGKFSLLGCPEMANEAHAFPLNLSKCLKEIVILY